MYNVCRNNHLLGSSGPFNVGQEGLFGTNFEVLNVTKKLDNGKDKAFRPLGGDKVEGLKGKENNTFIFGGCERLNFDLESSLASDMRINKRKPLDGEVDKSRNVTVEVSEAMEEIIGAIYNFIYQNASDRPMTVDIERMDVKCGGNVIHSS